MGQAQGKQVFISYVRDDAVLVDRLCGALAAAEIPYWRDRNALAPGDHWKSKIRSAIRNDALVFLACFSRQSLARHKSYMNEELSLAVEEFRLRPPGATWLIPIRLDESPIPDWDLGAGRQLSDVNYVDFFGDSAAEQAVRLIWTIASLTVARSRVIDNAAVQAAVEQSEHNESGSDYDALTVSVTAQSTPQVRRDASSEQGVMETAAARPHKQVAVELSTPTRPTRVAQDANTPPARPRRTTRTAGQSKQLPAFRVGVIAKMPNTPEEFRRGPTDTIQERRDRLGRIERDGMSEIVFEPEELQRGLLGLRVGSNVTFDVVTSEEWGTPRAIHVKRRM